MLASCERCEHSPGIAGLTSTPTSPSSPPPSAPSSPRQYSGLAGGSKLWTCRMPHWQVACLDRNSDNCQTDPGGVIVGATADLMLQPYGAFLAGCVGGLVATFGYQVCDMLSPLTASRIHFFTCQGCPALPPRFSQSA